MKLKIEISSCSNIGYKTSRDYVIDEEKWAVMNQEDRDELVQKYAEQAISEDVEWSYEVVE